MCAVGSSGPLREVLRIDLGSRTPRRYRVVMSGFLNFSAPPFSSLNAAERQRVRRAVNLARFKPDGVLSEAGKQWKRLHLILKGRVEARLPEGEEGSRQYGPDDLVGPRDFASGDATRKFVALEETVCLTIDRDVIDSLQKDNRFFRLALSGEAVGPVGAESARTDADTFALARVRDASVRRAVVLPADAPAHEGVRTIRRRGP